MRGALLLALLATGCGRLLPADVGNRDATFPHPANYETGTHGAESLTAGATCGSCHPTEMGTGANVQACRSCHPAFPHDQDPFTDHGADWQTRPETCTGCHGESGGRAPAARAAARCVACHSTYPHANTWVGEASAGDHGAAAALRAGTAACTGCHGESADAIEGARSCTDCHSTYPHPSGWADAAVHGAAYAANACGESCHDAEPGDGSGRIACASCHVLFPHDASWTVGHAGVTQRTGAGGCATCHESGSLDAPSLPVTCAPGCHSEAER